MRPLPILLLAIVLCVGGCQPTLEGYAPLMDRFNMPSGRVVADDVAQCRDVALEPDLGSVVWSEAIFGTALGGALGALAGFLFGAPSWGFGLGAVYGAVLGYGNGEIQRVSAQRGIVIRCLTGRGYSVLAP